MRQDECECPYCGGTAQCETDDVGVGVPRQCGPFICSKCWSAQMSSYISDEYIGASEGEIWYNWWLHPDYPDQDLPNRKMREWKEEYRLQQERYYSNRLAKVE